MKFRQAWVIAFIILVLSMVVSGQTTSSLTAEVQVCTGIQERMPTGMADSLPANVGQAYLWCKIIGAKEPTTIKHVWYYGGAEKSSVELPVNSISWRTWSAKKILPNMTGEWTVKIMDAQGNLIKEVSFKVY
jgi:hypothetical protein